MRSPPCAELKTLEKFDGVACRSAAWAVAGTAAITARPTAARSARRRCNAKACTQDSLWIGALTDAVHVPLRGAPVVPDRGDVSAFRRRSKPRAGKKLDALSISVRASTPTRLVA